MFSLAGLRVRDSVPKFISHQSVKMFSNTFFFKKKLLPHFSGSLNSTHLIAAIEKQQKKNEPMPFMKNVFISVDFFFC